jgi:hypothetical protein
MSFLRPTPDRLQQAMADVEQLRLLRPLCHSLWNTSAANLTSKEVMAGFAVCCLASNYPSAKATELYHSLKEPPEVLFPSQARLDADRSSIESQFTAAAFGQPPPALLSIWTNLALLDLYEYLGMPVVPSKDYQLVRNTLLNEYAAYHMKTSSVPLNDFTRRLCIFESLLDGPFPDDWTVNHFGFIGVTHEWKQLRTHFTPGLGP